MNEFFKFFNNAFDGVKKLGVWFKNRRFSKDVQKTDNAIDSGNDAVVNEQLSRLKDKAKSKQDKINS